MSKIITINQAAKLSTKFKQSGKTIVLVGGCFDLLHKGHIYFLEKSKQKGDLLFVLLESDVNIRKRKGENRPINPQNIRSIVLSARPYVDYIIPLQDVTNDKDYDKLIVQIKPDIITMTEGDKNLSQRTKQCEKFGVKLELIDKMEGVSTSNLIENKI